MRLKTPADEKVLSHYQNGMENCLHQIESIWLKNGEKKFIAGDEITIADIMACCELEQPGWNQFLKFP